MKVCSCARILHLEFDRKQYAALTVETRGEFCRTHVHRAGLLFLTVGVYHPERNATKSHNTVIRNMVKFVNRGLERMVGVMTGDANSACNKLNSLRLAMEGIVKCFSDAQEEPLNQLRAQSLEEIHFGICYQIRRSILWSMMNSTES